MTTEELDHEHMDKFYLCPICMQYQYPKSDYPQPKLQNDANKTENKISCCGQEMDIHDIYGHCMKCANRIILYPPGKELEIMDDLIFEYIREFDPQWKDLSNRVHELWKEVNYEGL